MRCGAQSLSVAGKAKEQGCKVYLAKAGHGKDQFIIEDIIIDIVIVDDGICYLFTGFDGNSVNVESLWVSRPVKSPIPDSKVCIITPDSRLDYMVRASSQKVFYHR